MKNDLYDDISVNYLYNVHIWNLKYIHTYILRIYIHSCLIILPIIYLFLLNSISKFHVISPTLLVEERSRKVKLQHQNLKLFSTMHKNHQLQKQ